MTPINDICAACNCNLWCEKTYPDCMGHLPSQGNPQANAASPGTGGMEGGTPGAEAAAQRLPGAGGELPADVLALALERWGTQAQVLMMVEEAAELVVALLHYRRGRATVEQVAEEIADVWIMAHQMRIVLKPYWVDDEAEKFIRSRGMIWVPTPSFLESACVRIQVSMLSFLSTANVNVELIRNLAMVLVACQTVKERFGAELVDQAVERKIRRLEARLGVAS